MRSQRLLPGKGQQPLDQRRAALRSFQCRPQKALGAARVAARYASLRQPDTADDDGQHVVEVMRDAAGEMADRFHLLHLPNLQLSSFPFSDGIGERRVRTGELCCRLARMGDPNSKGTDCRHEAGDDGDGEQGDSPPGRRKSRFQKVRLVPQHALEIGHEGCASRSGPALAE